jgi:hypothetical protein
MVKKELLAKFVVNLEQLKNENEVLKSSFFVKIVVNIFQLIMASSFSQKKF